MPTETREERKAREAKYWAERRAHMRPPGKYAAVFVTVDLLGVAGLWAMGVYAGISGKAALIGGAIASIILLMNAAESARGESRINVVAEVAYLTGMSFNTGPGARTPFLPAALIFVLLVILDFGFWTWPFPFSLREKAWIRR